jgi:NSS family neurotransmitter:Na+ symporter
MSMAERERFSSKLGFFLSAIGFAIGIGSLWRFPYLVGKYGGGVFLLFYVAVIFLLAIPLFILELSLGSASQRNPVGAYRILGKGKGWTLNGYMNVFAMQLLLGYTMPVAGWVTAYIFKTGAGTFRNMAPAEIGEYFGAFIGNTPEVIAWLAVTVVLVVLSITRGLNKGLERANAFCMPALFVLLLLLILRSVTLPGAGAGLAYYLKPDFANFTAQAFYDCIGQAFFAIGVAMAAGIVFGSYLRQEEKSLVRQGIHIGAALTLAGFLAGLVIFPAVFSFGLEPAGGPGLTFVTMPNVFNKMPYGTLFGVLFYVLFYLAALSSWLGGAEAVVAAYMEEFGMSRRKAVYLVGAVMFAIGSVAAWSMPFFEAADTLLNNLLILGGLLLSLFVGWSWGLPRFFAEANVLSPGLRTYITILVKYLAPATILLLGLRMHGVL